MSIKIAILSPHYPPRKGGVSDYSYQLNHHLKDAIVITAHDNRKPQADLVEITIPIKARELLVHLHHHDISTLLLEYTPLAFGPKYYGLNWSLLVTLMLIKLKKPNISIFIHFHEARYPFELTLRGLILGPLHLVQFMILMLLSRKSFFSTKRFENEAKYLLPFLSQKLHTVPIVSNILPPKSFNPNAIRKNQMIYFGGQHPTQFNHLAFDYMEKLATQDDQCQFIILGLGKVELNLSDTLKKRVKQCGHVSADEISTYYQESKLAILPLMDGVSTRRGTLMCAMAHGVPIVTNLGPSSDQSLPWDSFCFLQDLDSFTPHEYSQDELISKGLKAYCYYQEHFSLKATSKQLLSLIDTSH